MLFGNDYYIIYLSKYWIYIIYLKIILSLVWSYEKNIIFRILFDIFEFEINITRELKIDNPFLIINSFLNTDNWWH